MAKTPVKSAAKTATKAASGPKKSKVSPADLIEKCCEEALKKLQSLGIEQQLQSDLYWCLGSYRHDKNPSGLYEMGQRALSVFNAEKTKKTKGVTTKLITDLEKALATKG